MRKLVAIARSRTEPASRVERARMLLAYRDDPSFFAVGRLLGVHHQTVQRCMSCGRRGSWLAMRVNMGLPPATNASRHWCKGRCAKFSTHTP